MKKNKLLLLVGLIIFISFFATTGTALAWEVRYPSLSQFNVPDINDPNVSLPQFVSYFFTLGVALAGALALISFTLGAIQLIASIDNAEAQSNAKDRMKGAVLGLILTLSSFLIIRTINPTLITPVLPPLPPSEGLFLISGSKSQPAQSQYGNYAGIQGSQIKYVCAGQGPAYLIRFYPKENQIGNDNHYGGVTVKRLECGGQVSLQGKSLDMIKEIPGVYFYVGSSCGGFVTTAFENSQDKFSDSINSYIKSVKIVNDTQNKLFYGTILHQQEGLENGGTCSKPFLTAGCHNSNISASAADIFMVNQEPGTAGDGVTFYSESFGWDTGARAGFYEVSAGQINSSGTQKGAKQMCFDFTNVDRPNTYKFKCPPDNACGGSGGGASSCPCPNNPSVQCPNPNPNQPCPGQQNQNCASTACATFRDCPGSIRTKGDYIVGLYSAASYCQTFSDSIENLKSQPFVAAGGTSVENIWIIPIKR